MFMAVCYLITASLMAMSVSAVSQVSVVVSTRDPDAGDARWQADKEDDEWATKVLADPDYDPGWAQPCQDDWSDGGESHCEVREFPYHPGGLPIAFHGGQNGGMTVIGWDRDHLRVVYRVKARARTLERARDLARQIGLETSRGWVRPLGAPVRVVTRNGPFRLTER